MIEARHALRAVDEAFNGKRVGIISDGVKGTLSQVAGVAQAAQLAYGTTMNGSVGRLRLPGGGQVDILRGDCRNLRGRRYDVLMAVKPATPMSVATLELIAINGENVWM